jgi:hypothetical protein
MSLRGRVGLVGDGELVWLRVFSGRVNIQLSCDDEKGMLRDGVNVLPRLTRTTGARACLEYTFAF